MTTTAFPKSKHSTIKYNISTRQKVKKENYKKLFVNSTYYSLLKLISYKA